MLRKSKRMIIATPTTVKLFFFLHIVLPRFGQTKKGTVVHCCVRSLHSCVQAGMSNNQAKKKNVEQSLPKEEEVNVQRHEPGM